MPKKIINLTGRFPLFKEGELAPISSLQSFWANRLFIGEDIDIYITLQLPPKCYNIEGTLDLNQIEYFLSIHSALGLKTEEGFYLILSYNRKDNISKLYNVRLDDYKYLLNTIDSDLYSIRRKESDLFFITYSHLETSEDLIVDGTRVLIRNRKDGLQTFLLDKYNIRIIEERDFYIVNFLFNGITSYEDYIEPDKLALAISSFFNNRYIIGLRPPSSK